MRKIKRIVLINPKIHMSTGSLRRLPTPLGLLYLAAVLERAGYEMSIIDSAALGYYNVKEEAGYQVFGLDDQELKERIEEIKPDCAGITCNFSNHESEVLHTCRLVKSVDQTIITCTGGLHPTYRFREMLERCRELDFVIMKEGEYRFKALLDAINGGQDYSAHDGLAFRQKGKIVAHPPTSVISDLNALPLPARHLIDMERYIQIGLFSNPFPKRDRPAQILTSRGCPYHCYFCATKPFWGHFRARSAASVIEEMKYLKQKYNVNEIQFRDDSLLVDRKRAFELFEKMKGLNFSWCVGIMASHLDEEMLARMAESGCYQLTISIESGSERVLRDLIHKPIRLDAIQGVVDTAHKHNIRIHADNIVGIPGETREEMMRTFEFNKEVGVDSAAFFIAAAYLGSRLYEDCKRRGWLREDTSKMDFKNPGIYVRETDKEFVMPHSELIELVEKKTREHNEWSKRRNPGMWEEKYRVFLKKHGEEENKLMGRVV